MSTKPTTMSFDQMTERARRGLHRYVEPEFWNAAWYILSGLFTTLWAFVVTLLLMVVSLPLLIVGIGIPIVVGALRLVVRVGGYERSRARRAGRRIPPRTLASGSMMAKLRDRNRWRHVVFALTAWIANIVAVVAFVTLWTTTADLLWAPIDGLQSNDVSWVRIVLSIAVGAVLAVAGPWLTQQIARTLATFTALMIGPDAVASMQQQVAALTENRDEILVAVSSERQRIERNLHDGVQQQLVALGIDIGLARAKIESDPQGAVALLDAASDKTRSSIGELRLIGQGLHPTVLSDRGLHAALAAVAANASMPTDLRCELSSEPPAGTSEAIYFAASEAVTNAMKHSQARRIAITVRDTPDHLELWVYDDGRGGANMAGSGLAGIAARIRALNGQFTVESPPGGPTTVYANVPAPDPTPSEQQ